MQSGLGRCFDHSTQTGLLNLHHGSLNLNLWHVVEEAESVNLGKCLLLNLQSHQHMGLLGNSTGIVEDSI